MKKTDLFWQTYLNLEKELIEVSKYTLIIALLKTVNKKSFMPKYYIDTWILRTDTPSTFFCKSQVMWYDISTLGLVVRPWSTKRRGYTPPLLWVLVMSKKEQKILSIFIDELGDFGEYQATSPYYIVAIGLQNLTKHWVCSHTP